MTADFLHTDRLDRLDRRATAYRAQLDAVFPDDPDNEYVAIRAAFCDEFAGKPAEKCTDDEMHAAYDVGVSFLTRQIAALDQSAAAAADSNACGCPVLMGESRTDVGWIPVRVVHRCGR